MSAVEAIEVPVVTDAGESLRHAFCALVVDRVALCGFKRVGPFLSTGAKCVVCLDLRHRPCPHCGERHGAPA